MRLFALLLCGCVLSACMSPRSADDLSDELRQNAVISMTGPGRLPPGGSYVYHPGSTVLVDDPRFDRVEIETSVRRLLTEGLANEGWFPAPGAGVTVGYVIALDNPLHEDTVKRVLGVDPGLTTTDGHHERGTLVLELHRTGTNLTLWRGAVQILADPSLSEEVKDERVRRAISALLGRMP